MALQITFLMGHHRIQGVHIYLEAIFMEQRHTEMLFGGESIY